MKVASSLFFAASSSSSTVIQNTASVQTTDVVSSNIGYLSTYDPQAKMLWDASCSTLVVMKETITVPCRYDLTVYVHVGAGVTSRAPTASAWTTGDTSLTYPALFIAANGLCGIPVPAQWLFQTATCVPGTTSAGYSWIATPNCPPGCPNSCTSDYLNCTSCQQHSYRVATPDSTGQCPCLSGFYMDPITELCVACPLSLYCQTCAYDTTASAPKCLTCNCAHHRIFTASTKTCDCDATHHQDGSNIYCART